MCTVTYLPLANGFVLTSNRDERLSRPAAGAPAVREMGGKKILYPTDPEAGGTWIAASEQGHVLCLLNGAREKHVSSPPYRQSRGLLLLDFWRFESVSDFLQHYEFEGIEPFTLLIAQNQSLQVLRWDGQRVDVETQTRSKPGIWSSATLYSPDTIREREQWFAEWKRANQMFDPEAILNFHRFGGKGDVANDLVMSRPDRKQTVSISSVWVDASTVRFRYHDLVAKQGTVHALPLNQFSINPVWN